MSSTPKRTEQRYAAQIRHVKYSFEYDPISGILGCVNLYILSFTLDEAKQHPCQTTWKMEATMTRIFLPYTISGLMTPEKVVGEKLEIEGARGGIK